MAMSQEFNKISMENGFLMGNKPSVVSWKEVATGQDFRTSLDGEPDEQLVKIIVPYLKNIAKTKNQVLRVIDIGTLDGRNPRYLAKQPFLDVSALDIQGMPLFEQFRQEVADEELPIKTYSIEERGELFIKKESVDVVSLFRVCHLLPITNDRMELARKAWEILKPGGILILSVRNNIEGALNGYFETDPIGLNGNMLAQRTPNDVSRIYYGGLNGVFEDVERFRKRQEFIGNKICGSVIKELTFNVNDAEEHRNGEKYNAPCINVAFRKKRLMNGKNSCPNCDFKDINLDKI